MDTSNLKCNAEFQKKYDMLKKKYPVLQKLYEQGVTYEDMIDCPIRRQINEELGIIGFELTPIYKE